MKNKKDLWSKNNYKKVSELIFEIDDIETKIKAMESTIEDSRQFMAEIDCLKQELMLKELEIQKIKLEIEIEKIPLKSKEDNEEWN